ncbi:MAG: flagellar basal body-associated FliL family protein [Firmicutes bacterium]|jgi:flagellar FliL protein|nr:flagellar basal body-associated FliL family protein [Bacillota bacterium]
MADEQNKSNLRLVLIVVILLLIGVILAGGYFLLTGGGILNDPVKNIKPRYETVLPEFQVNLSDAGGRRYLRTQIIIGCDDSRVDKELKQRMNEIRSEFIELLRNKSVEDLHEPGGQEALREEIVDNLNDMLVTGEIKALYFSEFIIQ